MGSQSNCLYAQKVKDKVVSQRQTSKRHEPKAKVYVVLLMLLLLFLALPMLLHPHLDLPLLFPIEVHLTVTQAFKRYMLLNIAIEIEHREE
jgi:hypothetical protein